MTAQAIGLWRIRPHTSSCPNPCCLVNSKEFPLNISHFPSISPNKSQQTTESRVQLSCLLPDRCCVMSCMARPLVKRTLLANVCRSNTLSERESEARLISLLQRSSYHGTYRNTGSFLLPKKFWSPTNTSHSPLGRKKNSTRSKYYTNWLKPIKLSSRCKRWIGPYDGSLYRDKFHSLLREHLGRFSIYSSVCILHG